MKIDTDEKSIIEALRSNPALKACFLEMIDITDGEGFEELDLGDDAEDAVVEVTQKTAHTLLQGWANKKGKKAEEEARKNTSYRSHEKKRPNGKPL